MVMLGSDLSQQAVRAGLSCEQGLEAPRRRQAPNSLLATALLCAQPQGSGYSL